MLYAVRVFAIKIDAVQPAGILFHAAVQRFQFRQVDLFAAATGLAIAVNKLLPIARSGITPGKKWQQIFIIFIINSVYRQAITGRRSAQIRKPAQS